MSTIDHLSVDVPDIKAARAFQDEVLATLDCTCLAAVDGIAAHDRNGVQFLATPSFDGKSPSAGNDTHICFTTPSREMVNAFHKAGLGVGGTDEGAPKPRPAAPRAGAHAA